MVIIDLVLHYNTTRITKLRKDKMIKGKVNTGRMSNLKGSPKEQEAFNKAWRRFSKSMNHRTGYLLDNLLDGKWVSSYKEATEKVKAIT